MDVKKIAACAIAGALSLALLSACGDDDVPPAVATGTASAAPTAITAAPTSTTARPEASSVEPEATMQPVVVEEPVIISCDGGPGPVLTYWSDGTMTGSTPYCEDVAEGRRKAERDHNANQQRLREQSGPQLGDDCIGAEIGRTGTDAYGTAILCDNYQWVPNVGQAPRHPWADGQREWDTCITEHTDSQCREMLGRPAPDN